MTSEQARKVRILLECSFRPGSREKTFVRELGRLLDVESQTPEGMPLDGWEAWKLDRIFHSWRRQHGRCECLECLAEAMKHDPPYQGKLFEEGRE